MLRQVIIFLLILLSGYLYLGLRLSEGLGFVSWIMVTLLFGLVLMFLALWRLPADSPLQKLRGSVQIAMAWISMLFGVVVIRDLIFIGSLVVGHELGDLNSANASLALWILSSVLLIAGLFVVRLGPRLKNVDLPLENLPNSLEGTTIVQISDLHVSRDIDADFVDRVVRKIQPVKPDLIVLTGDIADGDASLYGANLEPFRNAFSVPCYYVSGNHEYYKDPELWFARFRELGFQMLFNSNAIQTIRGGKILIGGIVDPTAAMVGQRPDARAAHGTGDADVKILLAHQPGIAAQAAGLGFDIQLSGHTHGGQFFPWSLIIRGFHRHARGLSREGRMLVYVNEGTGHWGPPVRLGTRAEISVLRLVRA